MGSMACNEDKYLDDQTTSKRAIHLKLCKSIQTLCQITFGNIQLWDIPRSINRMRGVQYLQMIWTSSSELPAFSLISTIFLYNSLMVSLASLRSCSASREAEDWTRTYRYDSVDEFHTVSRVCWSRRVIFSFKEIEKGCNLERDISSGK